MYGMVNKGFEWMVKDMHGPEAWAEVCKLAGIPDEPFLSMRSYPDKITVDLVVALATHTNTEASDVLCNFGRRWVRFVDGHGYDNLLQMAGRSLEEVLSNLDDLHTRIAANFPEFSPPSFECVVESPTRLRLHYRSNRSGLTAFVIGLVEGVAEFVGEDVEIELIKSENDEMTHEIFDVRHEPKK